MKTPKKILFAHIPLDGHFNPLTGLAVHLKNCGYDVRWYSGNTYGGKIAKLGIPHYPFKRALEIPHDKFDELLLDRKNHKSQISKIKFDLKHYFVVRTPEYFEDIQEIYEEFAFDLFICDCCFTGSLLVKEKMAIPVISIGIIPLMETSKDLAPSGLALTPATSFWGRSMQDFLRFVMARFVYKEATDLYNQILTSYGLQPRQGVFFDWLFRGVDLYLQSGVPGLEYDRSDLSPNVRFIGPLLPYSQRQTASFPFADQLQQYKKVILVTQGTVEKDPEKIVVPTLEAFKDTDCLVIATTGGSGTQELKRRYPQQNIIIADFIDFNLVMPHADVYVTNGGFGGVLLGVQNQLPMVVAGVHEGKNEINARIGYFKLGINLNTEKPTPAQVRKGVAEVMANKTFKQNVVRLSQEFSQYNPQALIKQYVAELLQEGTQPIAVKHQRQPETTLQAV